jgi:hypothetical protein
VSRASHTTPRYPPRRNHGSFQQVAQDREHRVERSIVRHLASLVGDAGHELGDDGQVDDERRGEERVFADVVDRDRVAATDNWAVSLEMEKRIVQAKTAHPMKISE